MGKSKFEEIKEKFTDNELEKLTNVTMPNYIIALDKFNLIEHGDVTYIDVLRKFWEGEEFTNFANACDTEISGSLFSYENIQDRQYAINDFIDKYFSAENVQADSVIQNELGNNYVAEINPTEYNEIIRDNNEITDFHDNEKNYVQGTIPLSYNGYIQSRL